MEFHFHQNYRYDGIVGYIPLSGIYGGGILLLGSTGTAWRYVLRKKRREVVLGIEQYLKCTVTTAQMHISFRDDEMLYLHLSENFRCIRYSVTPYRASPDLVKYCYYWIHVLGTPSRVDPNHKFSISLWHHLNVFRDRKCVIEHPRGPSCAVLHISDLGVDSDLDFSKAFLTSLLQLEESEKRGSLAGSSGRFHGLST